MEIKYLGHSSFLLRSKEARLVTDPYDPKMVGLRFPKTEADIVTISHQHKDHNNAAAVEGNPLIIDMEGEYEKKGIRIFGYKSFHDKKKGAERGEMILYKMEIEGLSLLHCGDLGVIPESSLIDAIGKVDVIFVPVGGKYSLNGDEAVDVIKEFEPSIVIPMHYKTPKSALTELAPVDDFLKKIGVGNIIPVPKLTIKKDEINGEMRVVVLES